MMALSRSSLRQVNLRQKWREALSLFVMRRDAQSRRRRVEAMLDHVEDYRTLYEQFTHRPFTEANVLEIGFGAQPFRLIALMSMGIRARGIDLDIPMLRFRPLQLITIYAKNGFERALKTFVRNILFDRRDYADLNAALKMRGYSMRVNTTDLLVGDAASYDFGSERVDLVYSEDVFEHIPIADLERFIARLAAQLAPTGLALITPNIFTGITGGHLTEWYWDAEGNDPPRQSEPWEHLRKKRFKANSYLNGLTRKDYRELFRRHFEILEENVLMPELGRHRLTPEIRAELAKWDEEELLSNSVQFVLRPKP
jgi:hypothetical protein